MDGSETPIVVLAVELGTIPDGLWPRLADLLDRGERARAARYRFEPHRRQSVAAHALKRLMLALRTGRPPGAWCFAADADGKPRIAPHDDGTATPSFNLSHCDGLVACGVADGGEVGVDVEPCRGPAPSELVPIVFTASERAWLDSLPAARRDDGFFRLWTAKEAVIKATGHGLRQPLQAFAIVPGAPPTVRPLAAAVRASLAEPDADRVAADGGPWQLRQRRPTSAHWLAWAWRGPDPGCVVGVVRIESLLARVAAGALGFDGLAGSVPRGDVCRVDRP